MAGRGDDVPVGNNCHQAYGDDDNGDDDSNDVDDNNDYDDYDDGDDDHDNVDHHDDDSSLMSSPVW